MVEDMTPRDLPSSGATVVNVIAKLILDILDSFPAEMELKEAKMALVELILNLAPVSTHELPLFKLENSAW